MTVVSIVLALTAVGSVTTIPEVLAEVITGTVMIVAVVLTMAVRQ